jgi:hypothetical protein
VGQVSEPVFKAPALRPFTYNCKDPESDRQKVFCAREEHQLFLPLIGKAYLSGFRDLRAC